MVDFPAAAKELHQGKVIERNAWNGLKYLHKQNDGTFLIGIGIPANHHWDMPAEDLMAEDWIIS